MKDTDGNSLQGADSASNRDETLLRRPTSELTQLTYVLCALLLTCIAFLFALLAWGTLTNGDAIPSRRTTILLGFAVFLGLLAFRWRWARIAALVSAVAAVACTATGV